jgi:ubiquinone biosynthesis protein
MQDPALIPTPLVIERGQLEIAEPIPKDPWRLFRMFAFALSATLLWWKAKLSITVTGDATTGKGARRLRRFLERMGGMWVKAGQLAALRRDVFLPETCDELSKLQDTATGFPWHYAKAMVEEELGGPLDTFFSEFDPQPIAAASIGQIHSARLRENGVRVAVKVQRPFIAEHFSQDMKYLRFVEKLLIRLGLGAQVRLDELLWELQNTVGEELDYRVEASSAARMRKSLKKHGVYAPKVFFRYCRRRVLVMEFLEGPSMAEFIKTSRAEPARVRAWLRANEVEPKKLGERLLLSHLRQVLEDELYHADLHPGNIVLQRNSKFALIDFGSVGMLEKSQRRRFRLLYTAIAEHDYAKTVDMFLLLAPPLPHSDLGTLKLRLVRTLRAWVSRTRIRDVPYHEKSFAAFFSASLKYFQEYGISADWSFLRLNRADMTLDASLAFLCPNLNYVKLLQKYEFGAQRRAQRQLEVGPGAVVSAFTSLNTAVRQWTENVAFDGEWLRKRAMEFQGRVGKLAYVGQSLFSLFYWGVFFVLAYGIAKFLNNDDQVDLFLEKGVRGFWAHYSIETVLVVFAAVGVFVTKLTSVGNYVREKEFEAPGRGR